jgi:iron complex transport system ATP-binding protein
MTESHLSEPLVQARNLVFSYRGERAGARPVISDVSLSLSSKTFCGLIGANGCGKSTLLRLLSGVLVPERGTIHVGGTLLSDLSPRERARQIAYVPQQRRSVYPFTAIEVVLTGRTPYSSRFRFESRRDHDVAMGALAELGAEHLAERPITELSGGEQQLVFVARALAQEAKLLLLDEPASSLDLKHRAQLLGALVRLKQERGLTALIVTHELQMLESVFDLLLAMREGEIVARGETQEVLKREALAEIFDDPRIRTVEVEGRTFVWSQW